MYVVFKLKCVTLTPIKGLPARTMRVISDQNLNSPQDCLNFKGFDHKSLTPFSCSDPYNFQCPLTLVHHISDSLAD